jgi:hypothetical protein
VHVIEQPMAIKQHVGGEVGVNGEGSLVWGCWCW